MARLHEKEGVLMKAQYKTLTDGMGTGIGWLLACTIAQAQCVMERRIEYGRQQQGRERGQQQQQHGRDHVNWDHRNAKNGGKGYARGGYGGRGHH